MYEDELVQLTES